MELNAWKRHQSQVQVIHMGKTLPSKSSLYRRSTAISFVLLLVTVGILSQLEMGEAAVTAGVVRVLTNPGQDTHENSTAIPVIGFGATSSTGTDTLSSVILTINRRSTSFSISDIETVSSNMSSSGLGLYRDAGTTDDDLDPSDIPLSVSSVSLTTGSGSWTYTFTISSEIVPTSITGSFGWIVVARTSSTSVTSDQFNVAIPSGGVSYSDTTTMPSSTVTSDTINVILTRSLYIGTSSPIIIGELGAEVDTLPTQGLSIFSGIAQSEKIDSIEVVLNSVSNFDPSTDLRTMGTSANSGLKVYLDNGPGSSDVWDPSGDTLMIPQNVQMTNGSGNWKVLLDYPDSGSGSYNVPTTSSGSYDIFICVSTSSTIGHEDTFFTSISSWGLTYYGLDGNSRSVLQSSNRSRNFEADTKAPDLEDANLRVYTSPVSAYFYEADTDLEGTDEVFYNSLSGQGLGMEIRVNLAGYDEENLYVFEGEPAFEYETWNRDLIFSDRTEISYTVTTVPPLNPMVFRLKDVVGHNTTFEVNITEDNQAPLVRNFALTDPSRYIETQTGARNVYFRSSMISPEPFHIVGEGYEPDGESGVDEIYFTVEPSLYSSPSSDDTPQSFNASYFIDSLSSGVSSPIYVDLYDNVQNRNRIRINYSEISTYPVVTMIQPSTSGTNVSGVSRVIARVQSTPSILKVEFGVDGDTSLQRMTYGGGSGDTGIYYIDWDTVDYTEGEHVLKVKATDMTNGVGYNTQIRLNVNNYPLWGYFQSPLYGSSNRDTIGVRLITSNYLRSAKLYVDGVKVDTFVGYPVNGRVDLSIDTTQFDDGTYPLKAVLDGFGGRSVEIFNSIEIDNSDPVLYDIMVDFPGTQQALKPDDMIRLKARIFDNQSGLQTTYVVANSIGGSSMQTLYDNGFTDDGSTNDGFFSTIEFEVDGPWAYHTIRFVAVDRAGNTVERKFMVAMDALDPLIENMWVDYPGSQQGAAEGDDIQVKAVLSDSTAPIYMTLVLDNSGSMFDSGRMGELQRAAKSFINQTRSIDYVSLYRFYWIGEEPFEGFAPGWPKRVLNFTRMNQEGKKQAIDLIDNFDDEVKEDDLRSPGTPIWDTIGNATTYTISNSHSNPIVIAFTDGADDYNRDLEFEEGSAHFCPWHNWGNERYVDYHWGKYADPYSDGYFWVSNFVNESRKGLLNIPIPVYTVGLGLEHHDPPNFPVKSSPPSQYEHDNVSAYYSGESGTPEYNLWRIADTSSGGKYFYAPSATLLERVYKDIANSIYSTEDPAKIMRATAMLPLDMTLEVELYDDGLHNDGIAGDNIWASEYYTVPELPTESRTVIIDVWDWANRTNADSFKMISDNDAPYVEWVKMVYPEGRASVGDGEKFHIEINVTDKIAGIWKIIGDGSDMGFFPPITFNNTGEGNDLNKSDTIFTSKDIIAQSGNAPSIYHFLDMMVTDYAGNAIKARGQVLVVNDFASPVVSMITPKDFGFLGGDDPITLLARDDGEIQRVIYEIKDENGTLLQEGFIKKDQGDLFSSPVDVTRIKEGNYLLEVKAIDTAGRVGSSGVLNISIDNTLPQFLLHSPLNGSSVGGVVAFTYTFKDLFQDFVGYSIDGGPFLDAGDGMDTELYSEGYHKVKVRGFDGRGKSQGVTLDLYFDNGVPQVDLLLPSGGVVLNGTRKLLARVTDGGGIQYTEARIYEWGNRSQPTPPTPSEDPVVSIRMDGPSDAVVIAGFFQGELNSYGLPDGRYLLDIAARDRSGTEGHALQYLPLDNNAPVLNVLYPVNGGAVTGSFTPDAQADDPFLSKAYFTFNGKEYPFDATIDMDGVSDGKYLMRFVAIDSALRTTSKELIIYVDKTAPEVQLQSPVDGYAAGDELIVMARINEVAGIRYAFLNIDGSNIMLGNPIGDGGLYSFILNMTPFDRSAHKIKVVVENNAGMTTESRTITIYKGYLDTDGDGVTDPYDDDPQNPLINGDVDHDGFGSFYDDDDDGDGILDLYEPQYDSLMLSGDSKGIPFRLDPTEWADSDEDGVGDNIDPDVDGDGIINALDAFPTDPLEWSDIDRDGIGDNSDTDRDGDGVDNDDDDLPNDPSEWTDTDGDGVGNNKDEDDDGDGLPDSRDDFPTNRFRKYRYLDLAVYVLLAGIAVFAVFSALVFRERIAVGLESSWKEGRIKKARDRVSSAFKEKEMSWDKEKKGPRVKKMVPPRKRR